MFRIKKVLKLDLESHNVPHEDITDCAVRKKQIGSYDGRKSSTMETRTRAACMRDVRRRSRLRTHAFIQMRVCARAFSLARVYRQMHFLSPVFIRVRRLRDPLSSLGITGTSAHLSSTHVRNPSCWTSHCHRPFTCAMHLHVHATRVAICCVAARYYQWVR